VGRVSSSVGEGESRTRGGVVLPSSSSGGAFGVEALDVAELSDEI
jgi:hypothetical protein